MPATLTTAAAAPGPEAVLVCTTDNVTWSAVDSSTCWVCACPGVPDVVIDAEAGKDITLISAPVRPAPDCSMLLAETSHLGAYLAEIGVTAADFFNLGLGE
jgi:hypothetical protein